MSEKTSIERLRERHRSARHGIGLRRPHFDALLEGAPGIDFFEVIAENTMTIGGRTRAVVDALAERFPIVVHGVNLSLAGPDPFAGEYLDALEGLIERIDPPWFSDHLTYSRAFGVEYHDLIPFPFSRAALDRVTERVLYVKERFGRPFLVENSSYYAAFPAAELSEARFLCELVERTGCGLLLDVNNVYVNAVNHGYDPYEFIDTLPARAVVQIHMAGHDDSGTFLVDTHGARAIEPVLDLYEHALRRTGPVWTVFEWDNRIPPLETLLAENDRVRERGRRALAAGEPATRPEWNPPKRPAAATPPPASPPADLDATYRRMHALLRGRVTAKEVAERLGVAAERLAIYARFVRDHVRALLVKNYPVLAGVLGEASFEALAADYFEQQPPWHFELNENAGRLPDALAELADDPANPVGWFHAELATLEWTEWKVYRDTAVLPVDAPPDRPLVNPTLVPLDLDYPVASFVFDWRAGQRPPPPAPAAELSLVVRHPRTHRVSTLAATEPLMLALKMAADGLDVE